MKPRCVITINGKPASGPLMKRLISCVVTDKEGVTSDTCNIVLNNHPSAQVPPKDAIIKIWMGYFGGVMGFMGTFKVDEVSLSLFPHTMSVTGKAADFRQKMKENKERHWDDATVEKIVGDIAKDHELEAKVDLEVGAYTYKWFGQQDESDMNVLRRLEKVHGALFSPKDGALIFAKRGAGKTPSGKSLTPFIVTPQNIIAGSGKITFSDRASYKNVTAYTQDRAKLERTEVSETSSDDGNATYRIGSPFADADEARQAAKSKASDLKRQAIKFSCTVIGDPGVRAGSPLRFADMQVGLGGHEFIIDTGKHAWSKTSYVVSLDGKLQA